MNATIRRRTARIGGVAVAATMACAGLLVPAGAASAASAAAIARPTAARVAAAALECDIEYRNSDQRVHAYCSGNGAWTLHVKCWPGIWRTASTTTHGYSELSLGCGIFQTQDWYVSFP